MTTVAVILSGSGHLDGSEIHESVLTLYYLDRAGARVRIFAPDRDQHHVVNHLTGKPTGERRNVLVESARIARGRIEDLSRARIAELDAVILPGGYGAAKNLCTFAFDGADCTLDPGVEDLLRAALREKRPIGAICIAPAVVARVLETEGRKGALTIGNDAATARTLETLGAVHRNASVSEVVVDEALRIVSTPAYMLGPSIAAVASGIEKLVERVLSLAAAR